ncbi:outer membrane beta-barrel protein [Aurantimonas aggregata]|uniref:Outer membrane beta-barrel protein n=1 Tax=Aurantimonas aggregata TaxID=2047720 RepID=A0A6L9MH24_9HYPH|nr:outer membrane beta-barrel protein [Aurantimonas aggregata]NDV87125.1 outer membrane beta-barrel protein [Aurantimonas aggregata]
MTPLFPRLSTLLVAAALGALTTASPDHAAAQTLVMPELRTGSDLMGGEALDGIRRQADKPRVGTGEALDTNSQDLRSGRSSDQALPPDERYEPLAEEIDEEEPPVAPSFDLFEAAPPRPAGQAGLSGRSRPVRPIPGAALRSDQEDDFEDPAFRQSAATPALPTASNPPLSAGVAGETPGSFDQLRGNRPALALQRIVRRPADDPFAPIGIRAGSFILFPELIQDIGASTNLDEEPGGEGGVFSETTVSARLLSDWSMHEAEFNTRLTYRRNFAGEVPEDPRAAVDGRLRLDIDRVTTATFRGALEYRREDPVEIDVALAGAERPDVLSGSASAQLQREFGRLVLGGTGTVAREDYSGLPEGFSDQSYTTLTGALRAGYRLSPALQPFLEGSLGQRLFDETDTGDVGRDSLIPALRAGVGIDLSEKLSGEIAAGYAWNQPEDDRAETTAAPTLDASLQWSPRRGTDVTLAARTTFEPESSGQSTTVSYEGSLGVTHILTARTDLTAAITATLADSSLPSSDEIEWIGEAGFNYWLTRSLALTGIYSHRELYSEVAGADYRADTIRLGVKLQR